MQKTGAIGGELIVIDTIAMDVAHEDGSPRYSSGKFALIDIDAAIFAAMWWRWRVLVDRL